MATTIYAKIIKVIKLDYETESGLGLLLSRFCCIINIAKENEKEKISTENNKNRCTMYNFLSEEGTLNLLMK